MAPIRPHAMYTTVSEGVSFYTRVYGGSAEVYNIMPLRVPCRKSIDSKFYFFYLANISCGKRLVVADCLPDQVMSISIREIQKKWWMKFGDH